MLYLAVAFTAFVAAILFAKQFFAWPLLIATPFALVQVTYDWKGRRRVLLPELAGAIAIASLAPALALGAGWGWPASLALWAVMIARSTPAIVYVRACLARLHGKSVSTLPVWVVHALAIAVVAALARAGVAPQLGVVAMVILLVRAVGGIYLHGVTPKQLGFSEIAFGTITVLAVVFGSLFQL
uniref:Uncharacterized protein n=1 Tax=uncultured organism TaxID=155900 RepID=Q0GNJ8_9ZZZZ|nr:hypothetical protein [uncultured organism]